MRKFYLIFGFLGLLFSTNAFAQPAPGCPYIDAVDAATGAQSITTSCSNPCVDISSTVLQTGGTDTYTVSSIPYNPPFPYSGGTPVSVNMDDIYSGIIDLPFDFCFYGQSYNQVVVGSNGVITFDVSQAGAYCPWSFTASVPSTSLPLNAIFGSYLDIDPSVCGNVYYDITGTYPCRTFVFKFDQVCYFSCTSLMTSQEVVLYEGTNVIEVYIQDHPVCSGWNSGNAVIGIQNATGTVGLAPPGRNTGPWTANNEAWRFTPAGTPNYTINWYDPGGTQVGTGPTLSNICPGSTSTYTAEVVYQNCNGANIVATDDITIYVNFASNAGPDDQVCGLTYDLQAVLDSSATSAQWENTTGATFTNQFSPTSQVTVNNYGIYSFVWTTGSISGSCSDTVNIKFNPVPTSDFTVTPINCFGDQTTVTYTGTGSVGATYYWDFAGGTPAPDSTQGPFNVSWATPGTYDLSLWVDEAGCTSNTTTVSVVSPTQLVNDVIVDTAACAGTNTTVTNNSSGGTTPYTYTWSNGTGTNFSTGTYYVTTTDNNGCTDVDTFSVNVPNALVSVPYPTDLLCYQDNSGSGYVSVTGGTSPYSYSWSNNASLNDSAQSGLSAGTYTVSITDGNGCQITQDITLNEPSQLQAQITGTTDVSCIGNCDGTATVLGTQATPPYSYLWTNGDTTTTASSLCAGNPIVTVTDANGCTTTTTATISEPTAITAAIVSTTNVSCYGLCDGTATAQGTGGTPPYSYNWSSGGNLMTETNICAGPVSVTITDVNGCTATASSSITEPTEVVGSFTNVNDASCWGYSDGTATVGATGGTSPYNYYWWTGTNGNNPTQNLSFGTHTVTITDANGCTDTVSVTINQPPLVNIQFVNAVEPLCHGSCDGQLTAVGSGGTGAFTYIWDNGITGPTNYGVCADTIFVTVTDAQGCFRVKDTIFSDPPAIIASTPPQLYDCKGQPIAIDAAATGGNAPYVFHWNTGDSTQSITVSPIQTTQYNVYATDANGCNSGTMNTIITVYPDVHVTATTTEDSICPGESVIITSHITGGHAPINLYIDGLLSDSTEELFPVQSHSYSISVEDDCGLTDSYDIPIWVYSVPVISFSSDTLSGCQPLSVTFNPYGNLSNIQSFQWDFGDNSDNNLSFLQSPTHIYDNYGTFSVTLFYTTINNCNNQYEFPNMIKVYEKPDARFDAEPDIVSVVQPIVHFENQSSDLYGSIWFFGDGDTSSITHPFHTFPTYPVQDYNVTLIAETQDGCKDTAMATISIIDEYTFWAPSAFSPDDDGINDVFYVTGNGIDSTGFHLYIYDRWGELVFETNKFDRLNPLENGWDGSIKGHKKGEVGVYTWLCSYRDLSGVEHNRTGVVAIIK